MQMSLQIMNVYYKFKNQTFSKDEEHKHGINGENLKTK